MRSKLNSVFGLVAATIVAFGVQGVANAAVLNVSDVSGTWTGLTSSPAEIPQSIVGLNTGSVSWGVPIRAGGQQSGYTFVGSAPGQIESDKDFNLGMFTHNNFVIVTGTSIAGAALGLVVNMVVGGKPRSLPASFNFSHDETLNIGEAGFCKNGLTNFGTGDNRNGCADRVAILNNTAQKESFEIDGLLYILEITGFIKGSSTFSEFWTVENEANSAYLRARFTFVGRAGPIDPPPSPVPLPAAGWLLLAALGALGAARARRKA